MDPALRERLLEKVALFPSGPGVYTFLDERSRVIYVGKAKSLRARVRSYFNVVDDGRVFYRHLRAALRDVNCVATDTEKEALLLENTLIKRHSPRWNIKLTDDKSFLQIELTSHEAWPMARLVRVYGSKKRKGEVFGPYSSARAVRETLRHIKRWFPLRTCSNSELRNRTRPCIEHEMGRCVAPCVDLCTSAEYDEVVAEARLFLRGKDETLLPRLEARMKTHAQELRYEQAARVRDQLSAIRTTLERQRMARTAERDQDVFGLAAEGGVVVVEHLPIREGQVGEPVPYELRTALEPATALNAFLGQFYSEHRYVPHEVLLPCEVEDQALLQEVLRERRGTRVDVKASLRTDRRKLVELASKNAALVLDTGDTRRRVVRETLAGLKTTLGLRREPRTIECFDVSTLQGTFTVASKVRFLDGEPDPAGYRTYKVRTVDGQDDFAAMEEVIERRLRRGVERDDLPDLLVVDGGPSQLLRARVAAERVGVDLERTELVGLAKARAPKQGEEAGQRSFERIHRLEGGEPILLAPASLECRFLARVRNAAHRAAITYHRNLRRKSALRSGLEEVPGVGPKRRLALLRRFGSLKSIRKASLEELSEVVPKHVAVTIQQFVTSTEASVGAAEDAQDDASEDALGTSPEDTDAASPEDTPSASARVAELGAAPDPSSSPRPATAPRGREPS